MLQRQINGAREAELHAMEQALGIIRRWPDMNLKDDLEALLGLMTNMNLVVSPSTAAPSVAGAMGCTTLYHPQRIGVLLGEAQRYP